jgi:hypothetical protein
VLRILIAAMVILGALSLGPRVASVAADNDPPPVATDIPVVTANPFLPEDADLTTCVGTLQRPGCGSSERGGWHQNLVAIVMIGGLLIIFGRVAWGVARHRQDRDGDITSTP